MDQDQYFIVNTKVSVPLNQTSTGTASVTKQAVVGVGTKFKTNRELMAGAYIVLLSTNECRRVIRTDSDTIAFIERPFSVDIGPGSAIQIIPHYRSNPVEIDLKIKSTDPDGQLNGVAFNGILNISKASRDGSSRRDLIEPIVIDGTGTSMKVNVLY